LRLVFEMDRRGPRHRDSLDCLILGVRQAFTREVPMDDPN
jgi:hypothetical protein